MCVFWGFGFLLAWNFGHPKVKNKHSPRGNWFIFNHSTDATVFLEDASEMEAGDRGNKKKNKKNTTNYALGRVESGDGVSRENVIFLWVLRGNTPRKCWVMSDTPRSRGSDRVKINENRIDMGLKCPLVVFSIFPKICKLVNHHHDLSREMMDWADSNCQQESHKASSKHSRKINRQP